MSETTVYGASDDLIEVDGALSEEFSATDDSAVLAFSNGVVLRIEYDRDGIWRVRPLAGASRVTVTVAPTDDDDNYSDRAVIHEEVVWVVRGTEFVKQKAPPK